MFSWHRHVVILSIVALFLLGLSGTALAGAFMEVNFGLNLFDIVGSNDLSFNYDDANIDGSAKQDFSSKTYLPMGLYAAYAGTSYTIGAELTYINAHLKGEEVELNQNPDITIDSGEALFRVLRFGPQFRYFFSETAFKPFVAGTLAYCKTTVDPEGDLGSNDVSHLDLGVAGGVMYQVHPLIALGGSGRFDYYLPMEKAEYKDVFREGDKLESEISWMPMTINFHLAFTF